MINSTLRLFNAVQVETKQERTISEEVLARTIKNGYVLDLCIEPKVEVLKAIEEIVGISGEKANASFHKSWSVIKDASMEILVTQQILHYLTTYGFEVLGVYNKETVYIPTEELKLPEVKDGISLTVVKAMNKKEILEAIFKLGSGIALAQETLDDIMVIVKANDYHSDIVENISNRELKAMLRDYFNMVPVEPVDFLRHLVSKLTDESLLIKNEFLIKKIKESNGKFLDTLIKDAPEDLASIFFRFKPLFLAMKSISNNKRFFNQLRKRANKLHKPLPEDYLNNITFMLKRGSLDIHITTLTEKLNKASIFRKIRLAYALNYRLSGQDSIVYRVRNGKGWATKFDWNCEVGVDRLNRVTKPILNMVVDSITKDIRKNVGGKKFYIPSNINYALPATEKQFVGNIPSGTWVSVPEDLIVGIHWENVKGRRIDLDLSLMGVSGKIGWDAGYRSEVRDILFSGDVTAAPRPRGASELFYIRKGIGEPKLLVLNYFNFDADHPVDCKVLAAHEATDKFGSNYMVDVSNIVCSSIMKITKKQNILGLIISVDGENRVYFATMSVGNSRTSSNNAWVAHSREYMVNSTVQTIDFREILINAGAVVVDEIPEGEFVNLSPESVSKETIINLLKEPIKV